MPHGQAAGVPAAGVPDVCEASKGPDEGAAEGAPAAVTGAVVVVPSAGSADTSSAHAGLPSKPLARQRPKPARNTREKPFRPSLCTRFPDSNISRFHPAS